MVRSSIRAKFLIHLVCERPALWDKTCEDYRDRSLKEISWREICSYINKEYNSMPSKQKEEFTKTIIKKWTHIRDSWVKSMKYGYNAVTKIPLKPYVYHDELRFLQKILKCKPNRYDLNMCQINNMHFEDFYRDVNEPQNSNESAQEIDNNVEVENKADGEFNIDNLKQEPIANDNETDKTEHLDNADDCRLVEDAEIMSAAEEEKLKDTETAQSKRKCILISSRNDEEGEVSRVDAPDKSPPASIAERSRINYHGNNILYENRHLNFFIGILPSVNDLDEDRVLEFQSGVISLLQNLRQSQKHNTKTQSNCASDHFSCKAKLRKQKSLIYNGKLPVPNPHSRRKPIRRISDPIAPEEKETDMEYLSDN